MVRLRKDVLPRQGNLLCYDPPYWNQIKKKWGNHPIWRNKTPHIFTISYLMGKFTMSILSRPKFYGYNSDGGCRCEPVGGGKMLRSGTQQVSVCLSKKKGFSW